MHFLPGILGTWTGAVGGRDSTLAALGDPADPWIGSSGRTGSGRTSPVSASRAILSRRTSVLAVSRASSILSFWTSSSNSSESLASSLVVKSVTISLIVLIVVL